MNTASAAAMPDIQASPDTRRIDIDQVGIRALRHPVRVSGQDGTPQHTIAHFDMYVGLPHDVKGTHMSRFVDLLNTHQEVISIASFEPLLRNMGKRLEASSAWIEMRFPYFINKTAPVSGVASLLDYDVSFIGRLDHAGRYQFTLKVVVPVTSLCPCSKQISDYGAHNQRSHITVSARLNAPLAIEEMVRLVEGEASCELFGLLKRPDEKWVTERAYDNPKFVEDLVRDIAALLNTDARIDAYVLESENFESIHNHSAYARIEHDKTGAGRE